MSGKVNLDLQTILDKQFDIDFKGYSPDEVDSFLDLVMEDYQT
jgi:DivIVA domain-containing protein